MWARKAQAGIEFMLSYGWAILFVMAAIVTLAFYGVLDPNRFVVERCVFPAGVDCMDFTRNSATDEIVIQTKNNRGVPIENVALSIPGCVAAQSYTVFPNGASFLMTIAQCPISNGRIEIPVTIRYTNAETGLAFQDRGSITISNGDGSAIAQLPNPFPNPGACPPPPECRANPAVQNGACFYDPVPAGTPCTGGVCTSNGICGECLSTNDCTVFGGAASDWQCIQNLCEPVSIAQGPIHSTYVSGGSHFLDAQNALATSWATNGYWVHMSGLGCINGPDQCAAILAVPSVSTCLNNACYSPYGCMQIPAGLVNGILAQADCSGTPNQQDTCSGATYEVYINAQACTRSFT